MYTRISGGARGSGNGLWGAARGKRAANAAEPTRDELLDVVEWQNSIIDMIARDRDRLAGIAAGRVIPQRGQGNP